MFYLIYISSAKSLFTDATLSEILTQSQRNNEKCGVTGILLYHEGSILQLLEGDKEAVMDIYSRIQKDNRHTSLTIMTTGTTGERNFPEWFMGFNTVTGIQYSHYLRLHPSEILPMLKETNPAASVIVKSFLAVNLRQ